MEIASKRRADLVKRKVPYISDKGREYLACPGEHRDQCFRENAMHSRGAVYWPSKTTKTLAFLLKLCLFLRKPTTRSSVVVHIYEFGQQAFRF